MPRYRVDMLATRAPRPDDTVHDEALPLLVGAHGGAADRPVEPVGGHTERPLHRHDPPGADEALLGRRAVQEHLPRLRADDAVDEQAVALLEGAHRAARLRAEDP